LDMPHKMRLVKAEAAPAEAPKTEAKSPSTLAAERAKKFANEAGASIEAGMKNAKNALATPQAKVTAGVVGAGLAALIAASLIGVGEVAIAGAAGYLAYRRLTRKAD